MSNRKLLVLTAVFLALLAFVVFFERKQPTADERAKAAKRLADFKAEDVASLTLERPDLPKVELVRRDKGRWTVTNAPASPADGFAADGLRPEGVRARRPEGQGHARVHGQDLEGLFLRRPDPRNGRGRRRRRAAVRRRQVRAPRGPLEARGRVPKQAALRRARGGRHAHERDARPEHGRPRAGGEGCGRRSGGVAARKAGRRPRVRGLRRAVPRGSRGRAGLGVPGARGRGPRA